MPFAIKPIYAILFLYPTDAEHIDKNFTCLDETADERERKDEEFGQDLYKIKQTIGNACGTIALIHAIANNLDSLEFKERSTLKEFIDSTLDKTPDERGKLLEENKAMANAHEECAGSGETEMDDDTKIHFVALIEHKGYLWKCDGTSEQKAIRVNIASRDSILESAAEYVIKFAQKNPKIISYSAMALNKF